MTASEIDKTIAAGQQARTSLAAQLARQFQHDPERFDPRSLERLGTMGLRQFLTKVGDGSSPPPKRHAVSQLSQNAARMTPSGMRWTELRRPERPMWVCGVGVGLRAGAIVTAFSLLVLLVAERILPVAREILS